MAAHNHRCHCATDCPMPRQTAKGCGRLPPCDCICEPLDGAFRDGYNAHAASQAHWEATHGAYRQHGQGENP